MGTVALLIAYDGTGFHGYQRQSAHQEPSVQGVLEAALTQLSGEAITTIPAGRTDAGVHASGQVVTFVTDRLAHFSGEDWRRAFNALLPPTVAVRQAALVADSVNARYSAQARVYRYRVFFDDVRDPLRERFALRVRQQPDIARMQASCASIIGEHDFAAFGQSPANQPGKPIGHTIRTLRDAAVTESADEIWFDFAANAFLTGMVRRLVGTLLLVGTGRLTPAEMANIVAVGQRDHPGAAAPPHGLCLMRVEYPPGTISWPALIHDGDDHDNL